MATKCPAWSKGRKYTLKPEGERARRVNVCEFIRDNRDTFDATDKRRIRSLKPGKVVKWGGGAAPLYSLRRTK